MGGRRKPIPGPVHDGRGGAGGVSPTEETFTLLVFRNQVVSNLPLCSFTYLIDCYPPLQYPVSTITTDFMEWESL